MRSSCAGVPAWTAALPPGDTRHWLLYEARNFGYVPKAHAHADDYDAREAKWFSASLLSLFLFGLVVRALALVVFVARNHSLGDVRTRLMGRANRIKNWAAGGLEVTLSAVRSKRLLYQRERREVGTTAEGEEGEVVPEPTTATATSPGRWTRFQRFAGRSPERQTPEASRFSKRWKVKRGKHGKESVAFTASPPQPPPPPPSELQAISSSGEMLETIRLDVD